VTDASVLIVSRDDPNTIRGTVEACLRLDHPPQRYDVIVYDDVSTAEQRDLLEQLTQEFERELDSGRLRLLLADEHRGLAAGRNRAAAASRSRFLFYVDGDAFPDPGWIKETLPLFGEQGVGVVASRVVYHRRPEVLNGLGGTMNLFADGIDRYCLQPARSAPPESTYTLYAMGCGLVTSRDCWRAVGGFDESIENYYDDSEYCIRAWKGGYKTVTNPRGTVYHSGLSSGRAGSRRTFLIDRGRWLTLLKHWPPGLLLRAAAWQACQLALSRRPRRVLVWLRAAMSLLPLLPKVARYRRASERDGFQRISGLLVHSLRSTSARS
jgi:GT2 family glycosyltransferase